jgi:glycine dehydrogenase
MESIGERNRNLCLIPKSAHGTNPASAHLAGMKVIPIEVEHGKIDMTDFKKKVEVNKKDLGALMITFPSTAGRYDESIQEMA